MTGEYLDDLDDFGYGNDFLDTMPEAGLMKKNNLISCISFKLQPAVQKFYQENEHTSHRLGDNVHRRYILQN